MLVGDVMSEATAIGLSESIADAAKKMYDHGVGCLVVVKENEAVGIITERNVALGCPVDGHIPWECPVFRHMTIQPETAHKSMDISAATLIMIDREVDCLPVVEESKLIGIIHAEEISKANDREFAYGSEFTSMIGVE